MTIDEAIAILGPEAVTQIVNSGHAQDAGHPDSLRGRATMAALRGHLRASEAYGVLAAVRYEYDIRSACKSPERLEREFLEDGSGRAMAELVRRGLPLPQSAALQGAWL
jgi:hypothetical protein